MKVTSTNFSGLKIIQSKTYKDNRGFVKESYKQKNFKNKLILVEKPLFEKNKNLNIKNVKRLETLKD